MKTKTAEQILHKYFHHFKSERTRDLIVKAMEEYRQQPYASQPMSAGQYTLDNGMGTATVMSAEQYSSGAIHSIGEFPAPAMSAEQVEGFNPEKQANIISIANEMFSTAPAVSLSAEQVEDDAINSRFDNDKFIENVCLSFNHGFGLMAEQDKQALRFECKEWMRAIKNNWKYHSTAPTVSAKAAEHRI